MKNLFIIVMLLSAFVFSQITIIVNNKTISIQKDTIEVLTADLNYKREAVMEEHARYLFCNSFVVQCLKKLKEQE